MGSRSWTELFFLDEAVALAAGHRPCFLCQRKVVEQFRTAWAASKGASRASAKEIDAVLHRERLDHKRKRIHEIPAPIDALPDGTMVVSKGAAFTLRSTRALRWTEEGYGPAEHLLYADGLLTPPSILQALTSGYRPKLHPSIYTLDTLSHE